MYMYQGAIKQREKEQQAERVQIRAHPKPQGIQQKARELRVSQGKSS
jgi:hypothetical protein